MVLSPRESIDQQVDIAADNRRADEEDMDMIDLIQYREHQLKKLQQLMLRVFAIKSMLRAIVQMKNYHANVHNSMVDMHHEMKAKLMAINARENAVTQFNDAEMQSLQDELDQLPTETEITGNIEMAKQELRKIGAALENGDSVEVLKQKLQQKKDSVARLKMLLTQEPGSVIVDRDPEASFYGKYFNDAAVEPSSHSQVSSSHPNSQS